MPRRYAIYGLVVTAIIGDVTGCATIKDSGVSVLEDRIVYQPSDDAESWNPQGLVKEDLTFESADGVKLHAWYCPVANPRAVVLYAHGNDGNLATRAPFYRLLTERLGVSVLAFDYRGYGKSEGEPSNEGLLADARAARRLLSQKAGVPEDQIILYGQALGGGVMVDLAANDGAHGLILESTFTSLSAVANHKYPLTGGLLSDKLDSAALIGGYEGPTLIVHGENDRVIPVKQAKQLYAAANEPKWLLTIPDAGHNWKPTFQYVSALDEFFNR
ncbi:alpha/beta hydrolase [Lacipirellula parvula]|uniref:Serine aminopeptidase S33 domain-containing protein n=1 Tax=Lacipirellula parvula TaxID=2650471 RepID=A0A5K7XDH2_9BACT|nr:alpha/beta hydrolase [Lacipirellula parvula]BBO34528.1 hypothetical protein PLANPX_4140 [Lacipirellula parvula]